MESKSQERGAPATSQHASIMYVQLLCGCENENENDSMVMAAVMMLSGAERISKRHDLRISKVTSIIHVPGIPPPNRQRHLP